MPRAHRHYAPGLVWHLTHRCHRRQLLLRFARDRQEWCRWLYVARQRYGLCVLDYTVTCNHIHLLVRDRGRGEIARSLQLIAGQTGQAYNARKDRHGAFWEDRYHATAVETGAHLGRCVVYIDLNMVRAGVVEHPAQWPVGGFHEIQAAPARYRLVDRAALAEALDIGPSKLAAVHAQWIEQAMRADARRRAPEWSEALAVGGRDFVERVVSDLGVRARKQRIDTCEGYSILRDPQTPYSCVFDPEKMPIRPK